MTAQAETLRAETLNVWQRPAAAHDSGGAAAKAPDFVLAQRAAHGDAEAFEQLYRLHHRRVYTLCLRMTQDVAEAEDIAQDVFIHLYRTAGSFRGESSFTTWLHRMTVNQVLMHFRRNKRRKSEISVDAETHETRATEDPSAAPSVDRIALDRATAQLPPGYRAVFILHDVEGYEHEEIGRMLGFATGTSKSQLHKARLKLRTILKRRALNLTAPQPRP